MFGFDVGGIGVDEVGEVGCGGRFGWMGEMVLEASRCSAESVASGKV